MRSNAQWEVTEDDTLVQEARSMTSCTKDQLQGETIVCVLKRVRGNLIHATKSQYVHSFRGIRASAKDVCSRLKVFLLQPVWIMRSNKEPKKYSRGSLFALDVIRFGGTFASIFVALFVALNYQSFFQIVSPYLDPVERVSVLQNSVSDIDSALKQKLLKRVRHHLFQHHRQWH